MKLKALVDVSNFDGSSKICQGDVITAEKNTQLTGCYDIIFPNGKKVFYYPMYDETKKFQIVK